ncbi:MAG: cbb3-type cytochrome oxidase assembly protein CcoS [Bacteroidia bacterium]
MSAIYIMVGASLVLAGGFLAAFIWSVKNGQFEDDYTPSVRMLFDNKKKDEKENTNNKSIE